MTSRGDGKPAAHADMIAPGQLRELIRAEIARHRPREVSRGTLELLAEASLARSEGGLPHGPEQSTESAVKAAVAQLRQEHPTLFEPAPETGDLRGDVPDAPAEANSAAPARESRDWLVLDARDTASDKPSQVPGDPAVLPPSGTPALTAYASRVQRAGHALAMQARRLRDRPSGRAGLEAPLPAAAQRTPPSRYLYAVLAGVAVLAGAMLVLPDGATDEPVAARGDVAQQAARREPETTGTARKPREQPARATPEPETTGTAAKRDEAPAPTAAAPAIPAEPPRTLSGVPEVIDTATLRIDGKVIRLFGVEWARGGEAESLSRYLNGRPVDCEVVTPPDVYRCRVHQNDLSKVVLYNGGGRASSDAPPDLIAAEKHARSEQVGVWRR